MRLNFRLKATQQSWRTLLGMAIALALGAAWHR